MKSPLQAIRAERHWSQADLAKLMREQAQREGISQIPPKTALVTSISRWENDHCTPSETYRSLLRHVTGLTDVELGFTQPPEDPITAGPQAQADELRMDLDAARRVDAKHVLALQHQVDSFRQLDRPLGALALVEPVRSFIAMASRLVDHAVLGPQGRPLARVLADAASLAGWQALDLGSLKPAWTLFQTAQAAARTAEDPCLLAYATGEQAYVLLELDRFADAVDLVRYAGKDARRLDPSMRVWLNAAEAEILAAAGEATPALRAWDKAATLLSREPVAEPLPYLALEEVHLTRWRGNVLARVGHPDATPSLTAALEAMSPDFRRATAGLHCDLAIAAAARGEHDRARAHATEARTLATRIGSVRQINRVNRIRLGG